MNIKDQNKDIILVGVRDCDSTEVGIVGRLNIKIPIDYSGVCIQLPIRRTSGPIFRNEPVLPPPIPDTAYLFFERAKFFGRYIHILIGAHKDIDKLIKQRSIIPMSFYKQISAHLLP
jgi:hypothetical protein